MICGSCGMRMDGAAVLACKTRMLDIAEAGHVPVISAMGNLPVVKDLVVDMGPFWSKMKAMKPWLDTGYEEIPRARVPRHTRADGADPQGVALHHVRLLRLRVQLDGVGSRVLRAGRPGQGFPVRRRSARARPGRPARGLQRRARDLGLHALLLLQRALPEGGRSARCDRQAGCRVDAARDRPRHGREAREVVRRFGEDDGLAARDRARAEDAGDRAGAQGDQVRVVAGEAREGADSVSASRGQGRQGVPRALRDRQGAGRRRRSRHRPGRARAEPDRARPRLGRRRARAVRPGSFPLPYLPETESEPAGSAS